MSECDFHLLRVNSAHTTRKEMGGWSFSAAMVIIVLYNLAMFVWFAEYRILPV
jgi:hypothetical protein